MEYFDLIKALHIISIIAWMAGLLYLPRIFVYHASVEEGSSLDQTFKIMERRLAIWIMNPAMILSFSFGLWMLFLSPELLEQGWMQGKILLLVVLTGYHGALSRWRRFFAHNQNTLTPRFYRVINEVPTILMIGIVLLAVIKP
ncbi:MAG: TIGR00701 family protein [Rhodospirillaceae bacterium]|nr:TIGR00701 family protein [Rhodospirillaceae bacterium]|tara:strand:+ start:332 stop:760 length:429 start_codon:yes stop_codon:yes gene_type:complete